MSRQFFINNVLILIGGMLAPDWEFILFVNVPMCLLIAVVEALRIQREEQEMKIKYYTEVVRMKYGI